MLSICKWRIDSREVSLSLIHIYAASAGKPILGINVGRLGFVAGLETNELDRLKDLVEGNFCLLYTSRRSP